MKMRQGLNIVELAVIPILVLAGYVFGDLVENFKIYPVKPVGNKLKYNPATGAQYTDTLKATGLDTLTLAQQAVYTYIQVDPGFGQRYLYWDVLSFYAHLIVQTRASDTTGTSPTVKWWVDAKDTTYSWQLVSDTMTAEATAGTTFMPDTANGYLNITQLPAQVRVGLKSDSGRGQLQVSSESYIDVWMKTLE